MSMVLEGRDLVKWFGGVRAVNGVDFRVKEGSITGLIGPNGAGKTTLFDLVTGHLAPDKGDLRLRGRRIDRLPPHRIARMGVGRTFQLVRLLPRLTAVDNLVVATKGHPGETLSGSLFGGWKDAEEQARRRALDWLEFVGMEHRSDVRAGNLSYGQSKLTEIARALTLGTDLLLLDEPMSGINPTLRNKILELIQRTRKEEGKTFLIIEHDIEMIMAECDEVIVMDQGKVLTHGPPDEVRDDPRVIEAYLGAGRRRRFTATYEGDGQEKDEGQEGANGDDHYSKTMEDGA